MDVPQYQKVEAETPASPIMYLLAVAGGIVAAIVGGIVWSLLVVYTDREFGYVAWGIGLLAGFIVTFLAKNGNVFVLRAIAILSSLLGILIGKYGSFYHFLKIEVEKQYGAELAQSMSITSLTNVAIFFESLPSMVGGFDALWVLLAVITAWSIPGKAAQQAQQTQVSE